MPRETRIHPLDRLPHAVRRAHPAVLIAGAAALAAGVIAAVLVGVAALIGGPAPEVRTAAPAPAPVDTQTVSPQEAKAGTLPADGPAPDLPPFGVDAQSLLAEVRSHAVPIADADSARLVAVGDRAIARGQPDLTADDVAVSQDLKNNFPGWSGGQYSSAQRCLVEYAERVIARNNGTVPPDSLDDHN